MATMLDAVINLKDNFSSTLSSVEGTVKDFQRTSNRMGRDVYRTGKSIENVGGNLTKSLTMPLLAMGTGAVKVGMEFESSMSEVAATMGITVDEIENGSASFELLEKAAKDMGATTQFSASEAAEALNYLALAGYDAEKSAEMLPKVLDLAAAGGLELAYASDLVTDSMSALSLSMGEADRFIDEMAKTAQSSNTDVSQLGEAILTVGANGRDLANGTKELNTAIGLLGNAGIKGSEAGTKLRNIIMAMNPTTDAATAAFKDLKTSAYDADGNLRPLNETLLDMSKGMEGLSMQEKQDIMGGIFNKQDMAAASTLLASVTQSTDDLDFALSEMGISTKDMNMNLDDMLPILEEVGDKQEFVKRTMDNFGASAEDAEAIYLGLTGVMGDASAWDDLEGKIESAEGTAQEMADVLMHNLKGAFTEIGSALEGVGIKVYEILQPALESGAEHVKNFIDMLNDLTPEQTDTIAQFVKFALVIGPILMVLGKLTTGVGKTFRKFSDFSKALEKYGSVMGIIKSPAFMVVGALIALAAVGLLVYKNWDKIKEVFDIVKNALMDFAGVSSEHIDGVKEIFKSLGAIIREKAVEIMEKIAPLKESFGDLFGKLRELFDMVMPFLMPILTFIIGVFILKIVFGFMKIVNVTIAVIEGIIGFVDAVITILSGFIDFIIGVFTGDWDRAWDGLVTMFGGAVDLLKTAWTTFVDIITAPVDAVIDILDGTFHEKMDGIKKAWDGLKEFFKSPIKATVNAVKKGAGWVSDKVANNYDGTNYWKGGLTWIHEKGAEIVDLPTGSRIYPHDKSLEMARKQGMEQSKIKSFIPKMPKMPKVSDMTQTIKQKIKPIKIKPIKRDVARTDERRKDEYPQTGDVERKLSVRIAKLADQIIVREEADIDKIAKALVREFEKANINMA